MHCIKNGKRIDELSLNEFRSFCVKFKADVYKNLNVKFSIESKKSVGGTATIRG